MSMLDKYEDFFKISRNEECTLYSAISRQYGNSVILKRFQKAKHSWDEVLKSRSLQFSQKSKIFPKMIEIFKNKGQYYLVYERPTGPPLSHPDTIAPLALDNFYSLINDLTTFLLELRDANPNAWVLPQWLFVHRNSVKLLHFEPFFQNKELQSNDHVFTYKVENNLLSRLSDNDSEASMPADKKRNLVFNLGVICYNLLTGSSRPELTSQDEYLNYFADLELNAEKRIIKRTKQKQLGQLVGKMLSSNVFQLPDLTVIRNFFETKAAEYSPRKKVHATSIEIEFEKITLDNSPHLEEQPRRKLRACCAQKEASLQKLNQQTKQLLRERDSSRKKHLLLLKEGQPLKEGLSSRQGSLPKKQNPFLPNIHKKKHMRLKTSTDLMNTTNSKPLMFGNKSSIMKYS